MNAVPIPEKPLQIAPRQSVEFLMEVDQRRVLLRRHLPYGLDVPSMQGHQVVEIGQPSALQIRRLPSASVGSGRGEQDGNDAVVPGDADHLAEIVAEVGQGDPVRAGVGEELPEAEEGLVGELDGPKRRRLLEEPGRVLVLEPEVLPMVVPAVADGHGPRPDGPDVPFQLLQAGPGTPPRDADVHESETGARIARLDDGLQIFVISPPLGGGVAHEDYRRTHASSGGDPGRVSASDPEQVGVDGERSSLHRDRVGPAELDPGRGQGEIEVEEAQSQLDRDQQNRRGQEVPADQPHRPAGPGTGIRVRVQLALVLFRHVSIHFRCPRVRRGAAWNPPGQSRPSVKMNSSSHN